MWLEHFGLYEPLVFYVFVALSALVSVLAFVTVLLGCCYKRRFLPGATIDHSIILGSLLLCSTVLLRGIDTTWAHFYIFEDICQVYVAPHMLALAYLFGGFLVKAMAIYHYHKHDEGSEVRNVEWRPLGWLLLVIALDAVFIIVWCMLFPVQLYHGWRQISRNANMTELPVMAAPRADHEVYTCYGKYSWEWKVSMSVYHGFLLLLAAIMVWPAMHYSKRRISSTEVTYLSLIVSNALLTVIAGTLLYFFFEASPTTQYAVNGGLLLYVALFTMSILLASGVTASRRKPKHEDELTLRSVPSSNRESTTYDNGYMKPTNNLHPEVETFSY